MNRSNKDFRRSFSEKLMEQIVGNAANDDNIAVSPSRLQAVLVLLSNWASPDMQRKILDVAVGESAGIEDANEFCRKSAGLQGA
jgi:hypothetical protein